MVFYRLKGQQLSEYALALALIAVALITACAFFGTNASDAIGSMLAGLNKTPPGKVTGPDSGQLTLQTDENGAGSAIAAVNASGSLMTYANSLTSAIETSGANGTTTEILALLDNYINQSLASGKLTPEQANELAALSKQGHELANIEAIIEDMSKNNPAALGQPYTYNGQTYSTGRDLAIRIGFDPDRKINDTEAQKFVNLYDAALNSGALNDPQAKEVVTTLTNQILNIANGVEGAAVGVADGEISSSEYTKTVLFGLLERDKMLGTNTQGTLDVALIQQLGAAKTTDLKSNQICITGGKNCNKSSAKKL